MWYGFLADVVVAVHVAYVSFVVLGELAILLGMALKWGWIRNLWFRIGHVTAIVIVALEAVFSIPCPLTVWESHLRTWAGDQVTQESFIGHWLHRLIFISAPPWVYTVLYIGFALVVIATFVWAPPRRRVTLPS